MGTIYQNGKREILRIIDETQRILCKYRVVRFSANHNLSMKHFQQPLNISAYKYDIA